MKNDSDPGVIEKFTYGHGSGTEKGIGLEQVDDETVMAADMKYIPYIIKEASIFVVNAETPSVFNACIIILDGPDSLLKDVSEYVETF